jgi:hypothetical protein
MEFESCPLRGTLMGHHSAKKKGTGGQKGRVPSEDESVVTDQGSSHVTESQQSVPQWETVAIQWMNRKESSLSGRSVLF